MTLKAQEYQHGYPAGQVDQTRINVLFLYLVASIQDMNFRTKR